MDSYLNIIKQLGIAFRDRAITPIEYGDLVREIDAVKNNLKNSNVINGSIETLIDLKRDLHSGIITEQAFDNKKSKLIKKIQNAI